MNKQQDTQHANTAKKHNHRMALWLLPVLLFFGLLVLMYTRLGDDPQVQVQSKKSVSLPAFQLPDLYQLDKKLTLADMPDAPFVLNVWGSWCPSCVQEHPLLMSLAKSNAMTFVGVNYRDETADALAYLEDHGNPYSVVLQDYEGSLAVDLGLTGAPESFVIDHTGTVKQHIVGKLTPDNVKQRMLPCLDALRARPAVLEQINEACK